MGLDTTHNAWHGAYSAFMRWRTKIAELSGMPPLGLMEGFYMDGSHNPFCLLEYKFPKGDELEMFQLRELKKQFPIKWECLKPSPLHILLYHSDCDGDIKWEDCKPIADELEKLLPLIGEEDGGGHIGKYKDKTEQFIKGLREAYSKQENLEFH